jgi:hypothetical protein
VNECICSERNNEENDTTANFTFVNNLATKNTPVTGQRYSKTKYNKFSLKSTFTLSYPTFLFLQTLRIDPGYEVPCVHITVHTHGHTFLKQVTAEHRNRNIHLKILTSDSKT